MSQITRSVFRIVGTAIGALLFALPGQGLAQPSGVGAQNASPQAVQAQLRKKVAEKGEVNVIVSLKLPRAFTAEGLLPGPAAVAQQRADIAAKRDDLIGDLAGQQAQVYGKWASVPHVALKVNASALEHLLNSPRVATIQEDGLSFPQLLSAGNWIGANLTWQAGFGGAGTTVVILDNGIDANHPFYGGRVVAEACWSNAGGAGSGASLCPGGGNSQIGPGSADFNGNSNNCSATLCSHGAHVAGIAAGRDPGGGGATGYSGTAPAANIVALQVFTVFTTAAGCTPNSPPCTKSYTSDQISALDYINNTLRTIYNISSANMSLGGGSAITAACDGDGRKSAIDNLRSNDIATVIAAGNDDWTNAVATPACISTAVTVGAVTDTDNPPGDTVTSFSNMHALVDLLAAGQNMDSSVPDNVYGSKGGTSMATPQVTGAFAVLKAMRPSWTVDEIQNHLASTGVLVTDNRPANPAGDFSGITKPRIQLDVAVAALLTADLRVTKDCKPDRPSSVAIGENATCEITVQNIGPDPAIGVTLIDRHISNRPFVFGTTSPSSPTCTKVLDAGGLSGTVTCDLGAIAAGASMTVRVQVAGTAAQDINDHAAVESLTPDPDPSNNVADDGITVRGPSADLAVTKDCKPDRPATAPADQFATCEITVTNFGPDTATAVVLSDRHISNHPFAFGTTSPSGPTCTKVLDAGSLSGTVTCNLGDLAKDASATVRVEVKGVTTQDINDTATVSSATSDPNSANNQASDGITVRGEADLGLAKAAAPEPVVAGNNLTYTLTVTNNGPSTATNVVVEDVMPSGVSVVSITPPGGVSCVAGVPGNALLPTRCTIGTLTNGASKVITILVKVLPQTTGILGNNAKVSSDTYDPNNANNSASKTVTVQSQADLAVTKSDSPDPVVAGKPLSYTIVVSNTGPSTALGVTMTDTLPAAADVTFTGYTGLPAGVCAWQSPNAVTCSVGTLDPGTSVTVVLQVAVSPSVLDATALVNTAVVSSATTDTIAGNNTASATTTVQARSDLAIAKTSSYDVNNPAPRITYTVTVQNLGASDSVGFQMVDTLPLDPKKIVYVFDTGNGACLYSKTTHKVTCNVGKLAAGASWSVNIIVDSRGATGRIVNTATVASITTDPVAGNNTALKEIRVKGGPGKQ